MKHKYFKISLAILLIAMSIPSVYAQKSMDLTLDEAINLALKNSNQLKLSNAKVDEAIANYHEMWDNHLPDLKISGSFLRVDNPTVDLKVKLGGSSSDTTKKSGTSGGIKVNQAAYGMANMTLPLFSGFRIKYGVESAKFLEQAAKLDAESEKEEVVINAINAYTNLYKSKKAIELVQENLKQQIQRVADFTNLEKNGLMPRNDLLKAQLQQSNVELTLLDAQNNYRITCINMDLMLGLAENTELVPKMATFDLLDETAPLVKWEQLAMDNRKDIASLGSREKAAGSAIKATKGEYYPGLALTGGYLAADIPNLVTITNALNIGIGLQYNLGTLWKTGAKMELAKSHLHQIQATEAILNTRIKNEIAQAYYNYLLSQKKIEVYARSVGQSIENFRITKNKYDNSLVTTTDLLEADVAQLQSQLNFTISQADAFVAYKKLEQTAGVLTSAPKATK